MNLLLDSLTIILAIGYTIMYPSTHHKTIRNSWTVTYTVYVTNTQAYTYPVHMNENHAPSWYLLSVHLHVLHVCMSVFKPISFGILTLFLWKMSCIADMLNHIRCHLSFSPYSVYYSLSMSFPCIPLYIIFPLLTCSVCHNKLQLFLITSLHVAAYITYNHCPIFTIIYLK